jgi:hypothetical protein
LSNVISRSTLVQGRCAGRSRGDKSLGERTSRWPLIPHPTVRSAAVTGAGGGLGRETALRLASMGYRVFREKTDAELDGMRRQFLGLGA